MLSRTELVEQAQRIFAAFADIDATGQRNLARIAPFFSDDLRYEIPFIDPPVRLVGNEAFLRVLKSTNGLFSASRYTFSNYIVDTDSQTIAIEATSVRPLLATAEEMNLSYVFVFRFAGTLVSEMREYVFTTEMDRIAKAMNMTAAAGSGGPASPVQSAPIRASTLFDGFFQIGFVGSDIEGVCETLRRTYGVTQVRRQHKIEWLKAVHAWIGDVMIEVLIPERGGLAAYDDYIPDDPEALVMHHHGYKTNDPVVWQQIRKAVQDAKLPIAVESTLWDGQLSMMYVDTRKTLGIYSEYILMTGDAVYGYYSDVPRN